MKTYIFFIKWSEPSLYGNRTIECGKFVKVVAGNIEEAITKLHLWAKGTKYHTAVIAKHEILTDIEKIK